VPYSLIREEILETVRKALSAGLVRLSAGNFSARAGDGMVAITPRAIHYDRLQPGDIAVVDLEGSPVDCPRPPSSETPMHIAIYRAQPEVGAICHTHSPYAIAFAMLGEAVPLANLELYACGAPLPVCPWACPGTPQAGDAVVAALQSRPGLKAVLLRNHGLVAVGRDLTQAYEMAYDAEVGMQAYHLARQLGAPLEITPQQRDEIRRIYG
jgi:ribulose-5-phosphate 4-epimerase/fuculose-1-phosphate aldolase